MFGAMVGSLLQLFVATSEVPKDALVVPVTVASQHVFSLENRYSNAFVSGVFKKNILLTLAYWRGIIPISKTPDWSLVEKPFRWQLPLAPGQSVSYHDELLPQYKNATPLSYAHFNFQEGFVSDGYLVGDGTCHLASLLAWTAKDAGLVVDAPTNHDFALIPDVPKEYGVSIFSQPNNPSSSALQNLYITNQFEYPVVIVFDYDGTTLLIQVLKESQAQ